MDRSTKLELLQRSLGLRHKLKVHDSMGKPDTHEEIALSSLARWELEDELNAIEEILRDSRLENVAEKRELILKKGIKKKPKK
ncbi:MAG: hypothetical protein HY074_20940 [Deltaproteobacteria bacterium]|nr:hypothetical protein [Deltaproteobacteria bacterium]